MVTLHSNSPSFICQFAMSIPAVVALFTASASREYLSATFIASMRSVTLFPLHDVRIREAEAALSNASGNLRVGAPLFTLSRCFLLCRREKAILSLERCCRALAEEMRIRLFFNLKKSAHLTDVARSSSMHDLTNPIHGHVKDRSRAPARSECTAR